ncbi:hypothetical protein EV182_003489 [Spiromyces aspiralis]|uniref:Uncharacterized protein n=1 Tax=Spiromyces aspiralis TaxID=68401 RepID=A0ACC1HTP7_9FUNG|nr:hypothetical protein EV182_003489 [Spiromyces aspiralis]
MKTMFGNLTFAVAALLVTLTAVRAASLTYQVPSGSSQCFYVWNDAVGKKVSFYFAVQEGGSFDTDFTVTDPSKQVVFSDHAKRQGDYVFTGNVVGEYSFCFENGQSSSGDKLIEFDIQVENQPRPLEVSGLQKEGEMQSSIAAISGELQHIFKFQKYFRLRENRHFSTLSTVEARVWWFALLESCLVAIVAIVQVYGIQSLFTAKRSRR